MFAAGQWTCVEWSVSASGEQVWQDGHEVIFGPSPQIALRGTRLGINTSNAPIQPAFDVYYDDLVVAMSPVGCTCM
jgi:hypothetical protein